MRNMPMFCWGMVVLASIVSADLGFALTPFKTARFNEVVNEVAIVNPAKQIRSTAEKNDLLNSPDMVETGPKSRAELVFSDNTVTRVGANTRMTFSPDKREVNLQQGTVIFHSPTGQGGGVIKTAAATAAVTGTTITVVTTGNGGFKLMVLEGRAKATLPNGRMHSLNAGQMTFVMPGRKGLGPVLEFDLKRNVEGSRLIKGFKQEMPSMKKIKPEVDKQQKDFETGKAEPTPIEVGPVRKDGRLELLVDSSTRNARNTGASGAFVVGGAELDPNLIIPAPDFIPAVLGDDSANKIDADAPDFQTPSGSLFLVDGDIRFNTDRINLSPWSGGEIFGFGAKNGSIEFSDRTMLLEGFAGEVGFFALNGIFNTGQGGEIRYNGDGLVFGTGGVLDFDHIIINNTGFNGDIFGFGREKVDITNSTLQAKLSINLESDRDIDLLNTLISSDGIGRVQDFILTSNGPGTVRMEYNGPTTVRAQNTVMDGRTIILKNVVFPVGAKGDFYTETGNWTSYAANNTTPATAGELTMYGVFKDGGINPIHGGGPTSGGAGQIDPSDTNFMSYVR